MFFGEATFTRIRLKVQRFQLKRFRDTILIKFLIKTNSVTF